MISSSQRPLPDNTRHSQQTNIHAPGGIRNQDLSRRAAGLCDELITRPEESYRLCCVVVCDLETSRMGAPYIYDISRLRVNTQTRRVLTPSSQGNNFRAGTILFFNFDKWMKDGVARHFGVVITEEEGYSGKLEKQVRRISITFTLLFAIPNISFHVMRRRRRWCGWWPDRVLGTVCVQSGDVRTWPFQNLPLLLAVLTNSISLVSLHELDIGRDGLGYIVLFFFSSHFVCCKIQFRVPYIRFRRQAPVIILQHWTLCTSISAQCSVLFNINTKEMAETMDIRARFIFRRRQNFFL